MNKEPDKKRKGGRPKGSVGAKKKLRSLGIITKKTPDKEVDRSYPRSKGKKTSLGINQFLVLLFESNESLGMANKMTDAEIERQIRQEFPDSRLVVSLADRKYTINKLRNRYNKGQLTQGKVPRKQSHRYRVDGVRVDGRTGKKPIR